MHHSAILQIMKVSDGLRSRLYSVGSLASRIAWFSVSRGGQNNISEVFLIKIDVEQHERQVLEGSAGTIQKYRPIIMIETNSEQVHLLTQLTWEIKYHTPERIQLTRSPHLGFCAESFLKSPFDPYVSITFDIYIYLHSPAD